MPYSVKILLDSINPNDNRLTTFELTYPRFIHSELLTHRVFSRNAASSRAIPIQKVVESIENNPAEPLFWGKNQKGMQASEEINDDHKAVAKSAWNSAKNHAIHMAKTLSECGVHKQITNRILEPFQHITVILSGTEFDNFFKLRCHEDAQPEFKALADEMRHQYLTNTPNEALWGQWHLPLVEHDQDIELLKKISVARCARISYMRHGETSSLQQDLDLHDRLLVSGHMSPFEHQAFACQDVSKGNFEGWTQYRHMVEQ